MMRRLRWVLPVAWWALAGLALPGEQARDLDAGNSAFSHKDYQRAAEAYGRALERKPDDARALFGRGAAEYRLKRYEEALRDSTAAAERSQADPQAPAETRSHARYNAGNALYRQKKFDDAAKQYVGALETDPADTWAKHNLEMALRAQKQQQQQQGGQGQAKPQPQKGQPPPPQSGQPQQTPKQPDQSQQQGQQTPPPSGQQKAGQEQGQPQSSGSQGNMTRQQASDLLREMARDEADLHRALGKNRNMRQRAVERDW